MLDKSKEVPTVHLFLDDPETEERRYQNSAIYAEQSKAHKQTKNDAKPKHKLNDLDTEWLRLRAQQLSGIVSRCD